MLIEFFGENFGCFRDEFRLSLVATDIDPDSRRGIVEVNLRDDPEPLRLLRAAALYGANASGKSTVLRAARALQRLISRAGQFRSDEPIPVYEPFAGDHHVKRPVRLGLKAVVDGTVYDYETTFNETAILHERLDRRLADREINLFNRQKQNVTGEWATDDQFKLIVGHEFRSNALLLSLADTIAPGLAKGIAPGLFRLLRFFDGSNNARMYTFGVSAATLAAENSAFKDWLLQQLKAADVGVEEMAVKRQRRVDGEQGFLFEELGDAESVGSAREVVRHRLTFKHAGPDGPFPVPYESESFGTRKVVELAPLFFNIYSNSEAIATFVDEIGASLHPHLLNELIQHVNCDPHKTMRGQLIFATHETSLIDDEAKIAILRRDQVYFTQKDSAGVAKIYSLSEFNERQNVNLRKRYLEGRYGAIPSLGTFPG